MIIRLEEPRDYLAIYTLTKNAFATLANSDGTEADRVNENRSKSYFIPELALVAEDEREIVGYIVLHKMQIEYTNGNTDTQLEVAPLAVRPDCFRQGIGKALMKEACKRAKDLGFDVVFLCGHPSYYPKFGFIPTHYYHIYHVKDKNKNAAWCMVKELTPQYLGKEEAYIDIE